MPEGPSIVILTEQARAFEGRTIAAASGNSKALPFDELVGQPILALRSWGKHFLIELPLYTLRIHFLLFGSYRIDDRKEASTPRLSLQFGEGGELNFYTCSIKLIDVPLEQLYDWRADVMSPAWSPRLALKKLRADPERYACDVLLDQNIFSGVGNIIKNEVLFRLHIHPLSIVRELPLGKLRGLVQQASQYSFEFKAWKEAFVLKQHWQVHNRSECPRCHIPLERAYLGVTNRRTFWCNCCQKCYGGARVL